MEYEYIQEGDVEPKGQGRTGESKYKWLIDTLEQCEPGTGICVTPTDGIKASELRARYAEAIKKVESRRRGVQAKSFVTTDGRVAVIRK